MSAPPCCWRCQEGQHCGNTEYVAWRSMLVHCRCEGCGDPKPVQARLFTDAEVPA